MTRKRSRLIRVLEFAQSSALAVPSNIAFCIGANSYIGNFA